MNARQDPIVPHQVSGVATARMMKAHFTTALHVLYTANDFKLAAVSCKKLDVDTTTLQYCLPQNESLQYAQLDKALSTLPLATPHRVTCHRITARKHVHMHEHLHMLA